MFHNFQLTFVHKTIIVRETKTEMERAYPDLANNNMFLFTNDHHLHINTVYGVLENYSFNGKPCTKDSAEINSSEEVT